jgi:hypothetical protein
MSLQITMGSAAAGWRERTEYHSRLFGQLPHELFINQMYLSMHTAYTYVPSTPYRARIYGAGQLVSTSYEDVSVIGTLAIMSDQNYSMPRQLECIKRSITPSAFVNSNSEEWQIQILGLWGSRNKNPAAPLA